MLQRLHSFIREASRRQRSGFVTGSQITEAINAASSALWKNKIKEFRAGGDDILLQPFKSVTTLSSGSYTLTNQKQAEIVAIRPTNESKPEVIVVSNDTNLINLKSKSDYNHIISSQFTAAINSSSSGFFSLPVDTFKLGEVFYHEFNGNRYEGQILKDREFLDRKNSKIVPSSTTKPIARVLDNKIEFHPIPTGSSTYTFTVPYDKFNPIARYQQSGNNIVFEFIPSNYNDEIKVYYYKHPSLAQATYSSTNGVETVTVVTDLDWNESAFLEIAARALVIIGVEVNNQLLAQLESIIEQNEAADVNN